MGRQKVESCRSKSRPSSSSLAAVTSPSVFSSTVGFGGYVGGLRLDASQSGNDPSVSSNIDNEVAMQMKRLSRKDPTTKLKALLTLSNLFKEKATKDIVLIVPQWAFEYKKLLLDYNRDVRRATHEAMINLVISVGRNLAPHIKTLMGPWWYSQFDLVSEVSVAAKRSLQEAFPAQEKRLDALLLCTTEILTYLEENIKLTPKSMSDKASALDESENMLPQVVSSSLLALATFLDVLVCLHPESVSLEGMPAEAKHISKARLAGISYVKKLLNEHHYFLDFLRSESPQVRSAAFFMQTSLIKCLPDTFNGGKMKTVAASLLGVFQEKDPICHPSMWEALILFSRTFPGSWLLVNVPKTILNRLWNFLKNGCFGSEKASYPVLVRFLDVIPTGVVPGEKFLLDFYHSLWLGRNLSRAVDSNLVFFGAFKQCFVWGLHNSSRYCNNLDVLQHFRTTIFDDILIKLLWKDYLLCSIAPVMNHRKEFSAIPIDSSEGGLQPLKQMNDLEMNYMNQLGKCIVEILCGAYAIDDDLLSIFSVAFQEYCLRIFKEDDTKRATWNIQKVIHFLSLLDDYAMKKGEKWPMEILVGPMLAKAFPLIKSLDTSDGVTLLSVAVSLFGPVNIVRELQIHNMGLPFSSPDSHGTELEPKYFIKVFEKMFVPWCFNAHNSSISVHLDLLLALLADDYFSEQWNVIISHATPKTNSLAMLFDKVRINIKRRKVSQEDSNLQCYLKQELWLHQLVDSAATSLAQAHILDPYATHFLRAVLGGSTEADRVCFLSRSAMIRVYFEILRKLLAFIKESPFSSVRQVGSLLSSESYLLLLHSPLESEISLNMSAMVEFSLEVISGTFFCLSMIGDEAELVLAVLGSIFIIDWEAKMEALLQRGVVGDDESKEEFSCRLPCGEIMQRLYSSVKDQLYKIMDVELCRRLGAFLAKFIRSVIFMEAGLAASDVISICCTWLSEVIECVCYEQEVEEYLIDQLLLQDGNWPLWVLPDHSILNGIVMIEDEGTSVHIHEPGNLKFVSLIEKFFFKIGLNGATAGCSKAAISPSLKQRQKVITFRPWLAVEMLCTWKWPGGSALSSFLPQLCDHFQSRSFPFCEGFLDSMFNILLEGALVHGEGCTQHTFNGWAALDVELEKVLEPFLRGLLSLVFILFKIKVWEGSKALQLFELLVENLLAGETINKRLLKILPFIFRILVRPLCQRGVTSGECIRHLVQFDPSGEFLIQDTVKDWLKRILLFPPLDAWRTGEVDMVEWLQLVIASYPLSVLGVQKSLLLERKMCPEERLLLLALFRKQGRFLADSESEVSNQAPALSVLLSELMVCSVGYCGNDFMREDWEFVFFHVKAWIQSTVVLMEQIAEEINALCICSNSSSSSSSSAENLHLMKKKLLISDTSCLRITANAMALFSLFSKEILQLDASKTRALDRIEEAVLRIFFCTALAEAIAGSYSEEAASIVAASRAGCSYFWDLVASGVINSSQAARSNAVRSVELWGLREGSIGSLYAILFSSSSIPSLHLAAYVVLSSEFVLPKAIVGDGVALMDPDDVDEHHHFANALRKELYSVIGKLPDGLLETDLMDQQRVSVFLGWSLLVTHLLSLPALSPARKHLVQNVQDFASSMVLDCLLQHIPVELLKSTAMNNELPAEIPDIALAAEHSIVHGSMLWSIESLWPVQPHKLSSLAAALFGFMLRVIPAFVREWFNDLRDHSKASSIELFARTCCSPYLIANEFSQIRKSDLSDEIFSISTSKSANKVAATYTRDDAKMDLLLQLSASYPLRPVEIECLRSNGISETKRRRWVMSMTMFIRNQNEALAEAIRIWKRNLDKEFEGVEECPICYTVLHATNHGLPRLACRTCRHKFHSACLYKWFSASHKSSCPLCLSPFSLSGSHAHRTPLATT